jgi:SAM-dependent methyltransferase
VSDPTTRFSGRVESYVRYRPGYPDGVLPLLRLAPESIIADVGSGTGISSELFLRAGHVVYGVEPNAEMRAAAETLLRGYPRFHSVAGSAEATTLPDASVDVAVAGQAFHWFDADRARAEFARILRPGGRVVLLWNTRHVDTTPFLRAYEALLQEFGTDYQAVRHDAIRHEVLNGFFAGGFEKHILPNEQRFGLEGLRGRLLSMSYVPAEDDPRHLPMLRELDRIFSEHARDGEVRIDYDTEIYSGRIT